MKLRVRHTKLGKIRFTSHRDTARHWERAVRKIGVPLAYSAGFTPRPRMSFGLALPTGAESLAEYLDLELAQGYEPELDALAASFSSALPQGYEVTHVVPRPEGSVSLQEGVVACTWLVELDGVESNQLDEVVATAMARPTLMIERERKGQKSTDDVRPAIIEMSATAAGEYPRPHLCAVLATNGRGLRPIELVGALFPTLDPVEVTARVLRTHQWIDRDGERQEIIPAAPDVMRAPAECA